MYELSLPLELIVVFGTILFSMTLHEVTHGYVAFRLGDDTAHLLGRLSLNPLKHIDPFLTILLPLMLVLVGAPPFGGAKPVPFNPARLKYDEFGAAMVAVAGPLVNLGLAIVSGLWLRFVVGADAGLASTILVYFFLVNIAFFVFNMIPIPPLDGSRVLYALAPDGLRQFMSVIERNGLLIIAFVVIFFNQGLGVFISRMINLFGELIIGPLW